MSVARRITQALVEADWLESAQKQRFTQVLLEVDTRPPPVRTECHIVELTQTKDAYERISRIYPYGGGTGTERVTLAAATVSAATGYTMDTTNNYLEYDAAPSRIDATVTWGDIGTQDDENATDASASNTLYYAAYNYLRQRITANEVYSLRVVGLDVIAYPGQTMRVTFYRYVDGWQAVGIDDDDLNILETTTEITPDGVRTVAMQLSTAEMWPDSDAGVAVDLERRVTNLERGGGIALGRIGGGTGDGGSLPGTISHDSTNEVADGLHTHQVDASADPGAAAELLKTTSDGYLDLVRLYLDALHAETGADLTMQLGDNAGAQDLSITDSDGVEVASIDSDGGITSALATMTLGGYTLTIPATGTAALATGLAGGQTIYGGTGSGDDLTLESTSHATKGYVLLQPNGGNVGIGTATPGATLDVAGRIWQTGVGYSVFIGEGAGAADDLNNRQNIFIGYLAGAANITGSHNVAIGGAATGATMTAASDNVYIGWQAGRFGTGSNNMCIGTYAGRNLSTGHYNLAIGTYALMTTSTGFYNVAIGSNALYGNVSGARNVAIGMNAGRYHADGTTALASPDYSVYIGAYTRGLNDSDNNSIVIGAQAIGIGANTVVLGNTSIVTTVLRGRVGVGIEAPAAKLHVDQVSTTGAVPVLTLDQADVSEEFLRLIGTSAADASQSLVDAADMTTPGALVGWIRVYIQDDAASGAITDGVYFVPFYAAPTA